MKKLYMDVNIRLSTQSFHALKLLSFISLLIFFRVYHVVNYMLIFVMGAQGVAWEEK